MPRNRLPGAARILAACIAVSCSDPPTAQSEWETWKLSFQNQQRAEYGGSACVNTSNFYCKTWFEDRSVFSGVLRHKRGTDTWTLDAPERAFASQSPPFSVGDSIRVWLNDGYCGGYGLTVAAIRDSLAGSFSYARDCHGSWRIGKFTGHR